MKHSPTAELRGVAELIRDGWANVLSGIGSLRDKTNPWANQYKAGPLLLAPELASIYESDGLLVRVVDIIAEDMIRAGWTIAGDEKNELGMICKQLHLAPKLVQALKWMRLFGGALIVLDINDGKTWDQPYDWTKSRYPVRALRVYSAARTVIMPTDYNADPGSNWFEELEYFTVRRVYGQTFRVHASRCVVLKGRPVPDCLENHTYTASMRYWGMSVIQTMFQNTAAFSAFVAGIGHLGQEITIGKYTISNLEELVAAGNWKALRTRIRIIDESKSVINAVLLGPNEKYERDSLSFAGVGEVFDRYLQLVSAYSDGIPISRLFGKTAGGLASNGDGDGRDYYNMIENKQPAYLEGPLLQILQAINAGADSVVNPSDLAVTFNPTWTPSQSETTKMRLDVANTDKVYMDSGVLSPEQVFNTRFKNGYSTEYQIEGDFEPPEYDAPLPDSPTQELEGQQGGKPGNEPPGGPGEPGGGKQPEQGEG